MDDLEEHLLECTAIEALLTMQTKWGYVTPNKKR